ncbi:MULTISPECIES: SDR family NAD(P)-dependent oxidoreductase [Shouchella]|uniref:SDR family NAD(P)-dependent oxidoreductase n=1 Tax=Shouchella TaxID=2893057 RepID=UPI000917D71B|nr:MULTISPECIES: SDR family NAD(P)-dependent oxidoreductase [Shouchella]MBX0319451.1 SDR family NAD(P)-dependent oxidoreductase [Shouchella clausii]MDO7284394.1 SDR family NAD(P)-dependent oxidoreductase [Shouchella clausii]MDO7304489.1 SDR family NAD(P)-dependent oxidoreductase [Shouchella clausii]PAE96819.1 short-chain dehydrogenase [Shouchella clausii]PAF09646.1 short-chain dehydrogenase [Shouchella clausii]
MKEHNKVVLITGANSGIGLELTKNLLLQGWEVAALIRSDFPNEQPIIIDALKKNHLRVYKADLADFSSLRNALDQIKKSEAKIDLLFNNAGVSFAEYKHSKQGRELHFEVNTLVPFIITMELRELLLKGQDKTIINTSSNSLLFLKQFDLNTIINPKTPFKKLIGPYANSKLALSLWTNGIAPELSSEGIKIRSVCPGPNKTRLTKGKGMPSYILLIRSLMFTPPSKGASRLYNAAFNNEITGIFINKGKETAIKLSGHEEEVLNRLYDIYKNEFLVL